MPSAETPTDGRTARRERGRDAVLDAMVDLLNEGGPRPTSDEIAERAGVSVASLFRYFPTLEDLQIHTSARFFARYSPLLEIPRIGEGTLDARIGRFVAARVALYDTVGNIARFARAQSGQQPHLARGLTELRRRHADATRRHFEPELRGLTTSGRDDRIAVLTSITSPESWDLLIENLGRTRAQTIRAWKWSVRAVLANTTG